MLCFRYRSSRSRSRSRSRSPSPPPPPQTNNSSNSSTNPDPELKEEVMKMRKSVKKSGESTEALMKMTLTSNKELGSFGKDICDMKELLTLMQQTQQDYLNKDKVQVEEKLDEMNLEQAKKADDLTQKMKILKKSMENYGECGLQMVTLSKSIEKEVGELGQKLQKLIDDGGSNAVSGSTPKLLDSITVSNVNESSIAQIFNAISDLR